MGFPLLSKETGAWKRSRGTPLFFVKQFGAFQDGREKEANGPPNRKQFLALQSNTRLFYFHLSSHFSKYPKPSSFVQKCSPKSFSSPRPSSFLSLLLQSPTGLIILAILAPFSAVNFPNPVSPSHHFEYLFAFRLSDQTFFSMSGVAGLLGALLNLNLDKVTGQIGLSCSPISVIGAGQRASW